MNSKIKETISKLLNLASNNTSEEEAKAAMAKARELALQHNVDLAECGEATEENTIDIFEKVVRNKSSYLAKCDRYMFESLSESFDCFLGFMVGAETTSYLFFGTSLDLDIIRYCLRWLPNVFANEYRYYSKTNRKFLSTQSERNRAKLSFYRGFSIGIIDANKKVIEASDCFAMVVADKKARARDYVQSAFERHTTKQDRTQYHYDAVMTGRAKGAQVNLHKKGALNG